MDLPGPLSGAHSTGTESLSIDAFEAVAREAQRRMLELGRHEPQPKKSDRALASARQPEPSETPGTRSHPNARNPLCADPSSGFVVRVQWQGSLLGFIVKGSL